MKTRVLTDSSFLVLAIIAERETHGYDLQKLVYERGFRFWTKLERSSIYNGLALLEEERLISARVDAGEGPDRKVYQITKRGLARLEAETARHLSSPGHPRSEIDLGIYALPFLPKPDGRSAFRASLEVLRARKAFLEERLAWCRARKLKLPALAFERPLVALTAEIHWLERVAHEYEEGGASPEEWSRYEYREPPKRSDS